MVQWPKTPHSLRLAFGIQVLVCPTTSTEGPWHKGSFNASLLPGAIYLSSFVQPLSTVAIALRAQLKDNCGYPSCYRNGGSDSLAQPHSLTCTSRDPTGWHRDQETSIFVPSSLQHVQVDADAGMVCRGGLLTVIWCEATIHLPRSRTRVGPCWGVPIQVALTGWQSQAWTGERGPGGVRGEGLFSWGVKTC